MTEPTPILEVDALVLGHSGGFRIRIPPFRIETGTFTCIIGPNGSGKSTLLAALSGERPPISGKVRTSGGISRRRDISIIHQQLEISPTLPLTVREFIDLGLVGLTLSRSRRRDHVREALKDVALRKYARDAVESLSGGQLQRAFVARSLARRPRLLLADEPATSLDVQRYEALVEILSGLRDRGLGVVLVTHDLEEARRLGDQVILCGAGEARIGKASEVMSAENLQAAYSGSLPERRAAP